MRVRRKVVSAKRELSRRKKGVVTAKFAHGKE
jgi:hypothetical protein